MAELGLKQESLQQMPQFNSIRVRLLFESSLLAIVSGSVIFYIAGNIGAIEFSLAVLVILGVFYLKHHLTEQRFALIRQTEQKKLKDAEALAKLYLNTIESLAIAIDAKDQTSHGHVRRTQIYATELGKLLGVSDEEYKALKAGALLHDIGKLAVPEYILNKPGELTRAESAKMKIHPSVGADIVSSVKFPYPVEDIVRYHHEKWDGTGYPKGLRGEAIPLVARIVSVVDFYDSTRCDRPYRAGMKRKESLALLNSMAGSAFDPEVVARFVSHLDEFDRLISPPDLQEQIESDKPLENASACTCAVDASSVIEARDRNAGFRTITDAQHEVYALHEIAQTIGSSLGLQDTVSLVSNKLSTILPFDTCVIYLVDNKSGQAVPAHVFGNHSDVFTQHRITIGDGVTGWVIATGHTKCSSSLEIELRRVHQEVAGKFKHIVVAPLTREDGAFGAITLYSESADPYTTEHVRLIEAVSQHASIAINNALTFEKTKESALIDQLTELPNARSFYMALDQRIAQCQRLKNREPITVMSMNLDDFKQVNNTLGHATGDKLLTSVATVIKKQLRQMDTLARFAGDEFVAILPMASHKTAFLVAERIQNAINEYQFPTNDGRPVDIGVSIGIASYSEDGETAESLLISARRNMQHDKHARRIAPSRSRSSVSLHEAFR